MSISGLQEMLLRKVIYVLDDSKLEFEFQTYTFYNMIYVNEIRIIHEIEQNSKKIAFF